MLCRVVFTPLNNLSRTIDVHEIAQIKSLLPKLVDFIYVEPDVLSVHLQGAEAKGKGKSKAAAADDEYAQAAVEGPPKAAEDHVLLFQFNDGELKSSNKGGKVFTNRRQRCARFYLN